MKNERSGNSISVLISGNYNNFVCNRELPEGATDDEYKMEFYKATALCEDALARKQALNEIQMSFNKLRSEYLFLKRYFSPVGQESPPLPDALCDGEKKAWGRLQLFARLIEGHKSEWQWQDIVDVGLKKGDECSGVV